MKARPNATFTFCVIFCTGRMSLLYPRKRSRTKRSSSCEQRPVNRIKMSMQQIQYENFTHGKSTLTLAKLSKPNHTKCFCLSIFWRTVSHLLQAVVLCLWL